MGLASFLSRLSKPEPASGPAEEERLRTQARHRLIGAALLVMLAVLLLPWIFDSPPRPLPGDLPIDIPRREAVAALGLPSERVGAPAAASTGPASEPQAARPVPAPPAPARPAVAAAPRETVESAVPPRRAASAALPRVVSVPAAPRPEPAPAGRSADPGSARPAAETAAGARYIVQIGAYADPATARAARLKVERLGLKTYVHEIEVPGGKRIRVRVGPYTDRDEAARVRDRLEKAGFQPGLLTL